MKISNFMIFLGIATFIFCFPNITAGQGVIPIEDEDVREEVTSVYKAYGKALTNPYDEAIKDILIIPFYVDEEKFWKWFSIIPMKGLGETYLVGELEPEGSNRFLFLSAFGDGNLHPDVVQMKKTDDGYKIPLMESDYGKLLKRRKYPHLHPPSSSPEILKDGIRELKSMDKEELKKARRQKIEFYLVRIACLEYAREHGVDYNAGGWSKDKFREKINFYESLSPEEFKKNEISRKMKNLKEYKPELKLKDIKPKGPEVKLKEIKSKTKVLFSRPIVIIVTSAVAVAVIAVALFLIIRAIRRRRSDA